MAIVGGTGTLGSGLALRLARAGATVRIGSRREDSAREAAERLSQSLADAPVEGFENAASVEGSGIVVLTVPFAAQAATLKSIADALEPGQVLVDATVPLGADVGGKPTRLLGVPQGSAAEQARELAPDEVPVVASFHTVSAKELSDPDAELDEDVLVCGDDVDAKRRVGALVERVPGLRAVNAGRLEAARLVEGITPLLIGINIRHKVSAGVRLTGLSETKW